MAKTRQNTSAPELEPPSVGFIADPPMTPDKAPATDLKKNADAFNIASMENAGGRNRKRGPSLFERMTGSGRARRESEEVKTLATTATTERIAKSATEKPAMVADGREPTFDNVSQTLQQSPVIQSTEEDPLEIPAFLRRQAN